MYGAWMKGWKDACMDVQTENRQTINCMNFRKYKTQQHHQQGHFVT